MIEITTYDNETFLIDEEDKEETTATIKELGQDIKFIEKV